MNRSTTLTLAAVLLLLPLGGFVAYLLLRPEVRREKLFSPPAAARPWAESDYRTFEAPTADPDPMAPTFAVKLRDLVVDDTTPGKWSLTFRQDEADRDYRPPVEVVRLDEDLAFSTPDGGGSVKWVASGVIDRDALVPGDGRNLRLQLFDAALLPVADERHAELGVRDHDLTEHVSPKDVGTVLALRMALSGFEDVRWHFRGAFDRRTRVRLSSGGSWTTYGPDCRVESRLACLHDAPVRMILDFCHGPAVAHTVPLKVGGAVETPNFGVTVRGVLGGRHGGMSSSAGSSGHEISLDLQPGSEAKWTSIAYSVQPASVSDALTVEAVLHDGTIAGSHGGSASGIVHLVSVESALDEIRELRVTWRPNWKRLLIDLQRLPGIPQVNHEPADLFDVRIPDVEIGSDHDLHRLVSELVQMQIRSPGYYHAPPAGGVSPFPMVLEDTTPREIVELYLNSMPAVRVETDPAQLTLRFEGPGSRLNLFQRVLRTIFRPFVPTPPPPPPKP